MNRIRPQFNVGDTVIVKRSKEARAGLSINIINALASQDEFRISSVHEICSGFAYAIMYKGKILHHNVFGEIHFPEDMLELAEDDYNYEEVDNIPKSDLMSFLEVL